MNRSPLRLTSSNPFYLISAACMLGGILLITNSLPWTSIPMPWDITLIVTLNAYEAALIALAWHLVRHRRLLHDGAMLVALAAFFLVDIAFLNAEAVTSYFAIGLMLNIILFLAAILKLYYLTKIAGLNPRDGRFAAMLIQLVTLFAVPTIFRHYDEGDLPAPFFLAAWWAVGLLIPICLRLSHWRSFALVPPSMNGIVRLLCVLPWLSFVVHLGILHYVYNVTFYVAEAAPALLGIACLMRYMQPSRLAGRPDLRVLQVLLPAAALFLSLDNPAPLCFTIGIHRRFLVTPTELSLAGAYLTYIYCFARRHAIQFLAVGSVAALAYIFGPTTQQVSDSCARMWVWIGNLLWSLVPKTAMSAGITAIAAAFAFLGLGAIVSFRRPRPVLPLEPPKILDPDKTL